MDGVVNSKTLKYVTPHMNVITMKTVEHLVKIGRHYNVAILVVKIQMTAAEIIQNVIQKQVYVLL